MAPKDPMMEELTEEAPARREPLPERAQCCRGVIYCFNLFYIFTGVALISMGVWVQTDYMNPHIALILGNDLFLLAGKVIVAGGAMILIVALFGCIAVRLENKFLIIMYFFLLLTVFVVEFSGGVLALAFFASAETEQNLTWSLRQNYGAEGEGEEYTEAIDILQQVFRCCGVVGNVTEAVIEYRMTQFWLEQSPLKSRKVVPKSCCRQGVDHVICQMERPINQYRLYMHDVGCLWAMEARVTEYGGVVGGVTIAISFLQLVGMVFAFCLYTQIPKRSDPHE